MPDTHDNTGDLRSVMLSERRQIPDTMDYMSQDIIHEKFLEKRLKADQHLPGAGGEAEADGKWTLERFWRWWKSPIGKFSSQREYHQNLEIETGWNIVDWTYLPAWHKQKNGVNTWNSSSQTWGNRQYRISERMYKGCPTGTSAFCPEASSDYSIGRRGPTGFTVLLNSSGGEGRWEGWHGWKLLDIFLKQSKRAPENWRGVSMGLSKYGALLHSVKFHKIM